jgi:hypothetical protein
MPYYRQKTWLPLAPRIQGLSVRESPYGFSGMGQAICTDNNGDIVDCTTGAIITPAAGGGLSVQNPLSQLSSDILQPVISSTGASLLPAAGTTSLSTWLSQNQTTVIVVGIGLLAIALAKGLK